jgi:hypothetical protein
MLLLEEGEEEEALMVAVVQPNIAAIFPQSPAVNAEEQMALELRQGLAVPTLQFPAQSSEEQSLE